MGLVSEQSLYNLTARTIEPWSPIGGGLLGGVLQKASDGRRAKPKITEQVEKLRPQLEAYEALCARLGENPADIALAWLLHQPAVTAPIIGPRTVEQLIQNFRSVDLALADDTLRQLEEIWPGPCEAPQAYAW